jgi:ubiquinone/menaquinone biosynthesis C-methylase UbiE
MTLPGDDHKAFVADVFGRTAERYDRIGTPLFAPLGRRLVELAEIAPGAAVLDVATGAGAVLVPAAEAAGPEGRVIGVDLSPEMVHAANRLIAQHGLAGRAEARVGDGETLDHLPDDAFDAVLCGCAISFFPNPERALAEFLRVLRPGGTAGVSRWSEADPRWSWYPQLLGRLGIHPRRLMAGSPDAAVALEAAGFEDVTTISEPFELTFADPEEWWEWAWAMPHRAALEAMDEDTRERFREAAFRNLRARYGITLRAEAQYAIARKPASSPGP